ncbi:hypothetical protein F5B20DRAFT_546600 [Whalleya microplaca]|nr:hypothetical protein F5B20DRAFT_546600 [Whalleya microplaca]
MWSTHSSCSNWLRPLRAVVLQPPRARTTSPALASSLRQTTRPNLRPGQQLMPLHVRKQHKEEAKGAGDVVEAWVDDSSSDSEANDNPEASGMGGDMMRSFPNRWRGPGDSSSLILYQAILIIDMHDQEGIAPSRGYPKHDVFDNERAVVDEFRRRGYVVGESTMRFPIPDVNQEGCDSAITGNPIMRNW